jgi:hypothetical protein
VNPEELWQRVGALLKRERLRRGWKNPGDVHVRGAGRNPPTNKTVTIQEAGKIQTVDGLERHVVALSLELVDILRSALAETEKPISPEALKMLRVFERLGEDERRALLRNAELFVREREP